MANPAPTAAPAPPSTPPPAPSTFVVPGAVRPPSTSLAGKMLWLYGEPKIGKTTFAASFEGVWFLATEKGQEFVAAREPTCITSWDQFKKLVEWIYVNKPAKFGDGEPIKWLVIDVVDKLFQMCNDSVCKALGVEDPGELAHGKGWGRLRTEFHKVLGALRQLPYGLMCISHERSKEITARGKKSTRIEPNVGAAGYAWLLGASDVIVRMFSRETAEVVNGKVTGKFVTDRLMQLHPTSNAVAGGRMSAILPQIMSLDAKALQEAVLKSDKTACKQTIDDGLPADDQSPLNDDAPQQTAPST